MLKWFASPAAIKNLKNGTLIDKANVDYLSSEILDSDKKLPLIMHYFTKETWKSLMIAGNNSQDSQIL